LPREAQWASSAICLPESPIQADFIELIALPGAFARTEHVEAARRVCLLTYAQEWVVLEEPVGSEHEVVVSVVDRVIDAASGTFGVRLELPNPNYELPAGLRCRVRF
jgi:hypothetical protein